MNSVATVRAAQFACCGLGARHAGRHPKPADGLVSVDHRRILEHRDRLGVRLHPGNVRRRAVLPGPQARDVRRPLPTRAKPTGAIPVNKLYTFSDQQLRGYTNPFYGTDIQLIQAELRVSAQPGSQDLARVLRRRRRDAHSRRRRSSTATTPRRTSTSSQWHADAGIGVRFDIPQLGLRTLRLDFAKGSLGTHLSFGIGQAF